MLGKPTDHAKSDLVIRPQIHVLAKSLTFAERRERVELLVILWGVTYDCLVGAGGSTLPTQQHAYASAVFTTATQPHDSIKSTRKHPKSSNFHEGATWWMSVVHGGNTPHLFTISVLTAIIQVNPSRPVPLDVLLSPVTEWQFVLVVVRWSRSMKLPHAGPS